MRKAEDMYVRVLAGYEKTLEPEHTSTVKTKLHLGLLHHYQNTYRTAEDLHMQALAGYEKVLGTEHTPPIRARMDMTNLNQTPISETRRGMLRLFGKKKYSRRRDRTCEGEAQRATGDCGEKTQNCNDMRRFRPNTYI